MTLAIPVYFHEFFTFLRAFFSRVLATICGGGVELDDNPNAPRREDTLPERRQGWPRTSLGSLTNTIGIAVGLATLFGMFWQGARWATDIDAKLDQAIRQGVVISQMQNDLLVLKTKFENAQAQAERVVEWLQSLSQRVENRNAQPLPPSRRAVEIPP